MDLCMKLIGILLHNRKSRDRYIFNVAKTFPVTIDNVWYDLKYGKWKNNLKFLNKTITMQAQNCR